MNANNYVSQSIATLGIRRVADQCNIYQSAVHRWKVKGRLPRTEFSGETDYAYQIYLLSNGEVSVEKLLEASRKQWATK